MNVASAFHSISNTVHNHGGLSTLYDVFIRAANKCVYYKNLRYLVVDAIEPRCLQLPPNFRFGLIAEHDLLAFAKDPENELSIEFVRDALRKGDECYGIFDGDILASYGWYSRQPTLLETDDLLLLFDQQLVYMYKGFTLNPYRGLRLHAIGKTRALAEYLSRGCKAMVFCVESNNFGSLKSAYRMGARDCGQMRIVRLGRKYIIRSDSKCAKFGLALNQISPAA